MFRRGTELAPPRLRSCMTALQQTFLPSNAASAKVWKGGAEIFYWSGGAGDDIVDLETACAEAKASST